MDSYNKTVWVNGANPPINAENLNHIESGVEAVNQAVTAVEGRVTTAESKIETLEQQYAGVDGDLGDIMDEMLTVEKTNNKVNTINPAAPSNTEYPTTAAVIEYVNLTGAEKFVEVTDTSDTAVDNCTDPDTVYIVRVVSGVVTTTKMRVICTPNVAGQMAQYAMTKDGYIISRKFTASEWGAWDFIPDSKRVAAMISAAIAGKADSSAIPTKTSQLTNDSGFLTSHQDVSGKENTSNKKTSIGNQSQTGDSDTNYPTVGAVRDFVNLVRDDLEDYVDEEIGNIETLLSQV